MTKFVSFKYWVKLLFSQLLLQRERFYIVQMRSDPGYFVTQIPMVMIYKIFHWQQYNQFVGAVCVVENLI